MNRQLKEKLKGILPEFLFDTYHSFRTAFSIAKVSLFRIKNTGDKHHCNFCGSKSGKFLPDGMDLPVITELQIMSAGRRSNVLCPTCGSKDRERWIWAFLESAKSDFLQNSNNTILHIAPEVQLRKKFKEIFGKNYINADLNPKHADVKMDITKIQFPDNHFDAILCNHVLEHIPNDQLAMSELHRVLKPKGWAILQVPLSQNLKTTFEDFSIKSEAEREEKFGQFDHVRVYGSDYFKRLENAGFKIEKVKQTSFLSNEQIQSLSLIEGEPIILAIKLAIKLPD